MSENTMNWPNDFDGAHHVQNKEPQYIYESPDKGKTIYRRKFGSLHKELVVVQYIYESPDKGKTVYRRKFGSLHKELVVTSVEAMHADL